MSIKTRAVLIIVLLAWCLALVSPRAADAGAQRFQAEYRYDSTGKEGYYGGKVIAQRRLKDLLLEDAAGYLFASGYMDRSGLDTSQVVIMASFLTALEITDEAWDGSSYKTSGYIEIEPQRISREINSRIAAGSGVKEMVELKVTEYGLMEEVLDRLKGVAEGEDGARLRAAFRRLDAIFDLEEASAFMFAGREGAASEGFATVEAGFPEYSAHAAALGYAGPRPDPGVEPSDALVQGDPVLSRLEGRISREPNDYRLYYERGSRYFDLRKYDKALADLNKASALNPRFLPSYKLKARIYEHLGDLFNAQYEYNKALSFSKGDFDLYFDRGRAEEFRGLFLFAINNYTEAIKLRPSDPRGYVARAKVYFRLDARSEEGIKDMIKAARLGSVEARSFLKGKGIKWQ